VAYESWLRSGDGELLEWIRAYNEEDCRSTLSLRDWLLGTMRAEAATQFGVDFDEMREPEPEEPHAPPGWMPGVTALIERLLEGLDADPHGDTRNEAERRLLAHLLLYHH